jgi:mannose-6-phosphate isomerase-like protein (cupin superfamily)
MTRPEPETVTLLDGTVRFLADGEQTESRILLTEQWFPKGPGPPLHTHPMTEVFHVQEGVVEVLVKPKSASEPRVYPLGPGESHVVPEMEVHTFRPAGGGINKLIAAFTPVGTGEAFFLDAGTPQEGPMRLPDDPRTDPEAVAEVERAMMRHEFVIVGR